MMNAFNAAYPWIVLTIGLFDASATLLGGLLAAGVYLFRPNADLYDRIFPSFLILILSTTAAVALLTGTRWLLGGL
jgi:hypothetical protein